MRRLVFSALVALALASPFAMPASAQGGIGVYVGPFPSSFVDPSGGVSDAVCVWVERTQLDNGGYHETAYCYFTTDAHRPDRGTALQDNVTSDRPFWSDYTYELTGEFELATTWSVLTSWDGTLIAESTYGAEPVDEDSAEFAGFIGSVIPNPDGGDLYLSAAGVRNQLKWDISDADILHAWDDGTEVEFSEDDADYVGSWARGVLVYWTDGHSLLNVRAATWADVLALQE